MKFQFRSFLYLLPEYNTRLLPSVSIHSGICYAASSWHTLYTSVLCSPIITINCDSFFQSTILYAANQRIQTVYPWCEYHNSGQMRFLAFSVVLLILTVSHKTIAVGPMIHYDSTFSRWHKACEQGGRGTDLLFGTCTRYWQDSSSFIFRSKSPDQVTQHNKKRSSYGHSAVIALGSVLLLN